MISLEVNPCNKMKGPHLQMKFLSIYSILHWNHIHPHPYIHPCFLVISLIVIEILHRIGWFMKGNQNWVIVRLAGACPQTPYPKTLPIKRYPGPHQHHKIVKYIMMGEKSLFSSHLSNSKQLREMKSFF